MSADQMWRIATIFWLGYVSGAILVVFVVEPISRRIGVWRRRKRVERFAHASERARRELMASLEATLAWVERRAEEAARRRP